MVTRFLLGDVDHRCTAHNSSFRILLSHVKKQEVSETSMKYRYFNVAVGTLCASAAARSESRLLFGGTGGGLESPK